MTGMRWPHKTTEKIRRQLQSIGIRVSRSTIARLLKEQGFALRVPIKVNDHDFRSDGKGMAVPYGVLDLRGNRGHVSVGVSHEVPL